MRCSTDFPQDAPWDVPQDIPQDFHRMFTTGYFTGCSMERSTRFSHGMFHRMFHMMFHAGCSTRCFMGTFHGKTHGQAHPEALKLEKGSVCLGGPFTPARSHLVVAVADEECQKPARMWVQVLSPRSHWDWMTPSPVRTGNLAFMRAFGCSCHQLPWSSRRNGGQCPGHWCSAKSHFQAGVGGGGRAVRGLSLFLNAPSHQEACSTWSTGYNLLKPLPTQNSCFGGFMYPPVAQSWGCGGGRGRQWVLLMVISARSFRTNKRLWEPHPALVLHRGSPALCVPPQPSRTAVTLRCHHFLPHSLPGRVW